MVSFTHREHNKMIHNFNLNGMCYFVLKCVRKCEMSYTVPV